MSHCPEWEGSAGSVILGLCVWMCRIHALLGARCGAGREKREEEK